MPQEKKNRNQNNRGSNGKGPGKKKDPSKEQCYFGKACKRKECIYKHDNEGRTGKDGKAEGRSEPREPDNLGSVAAFPPLSGTNGTTPRPVAPAGAWGAASLGAAQVATAAPIKQVPRQAASPQTVTNTAAVTAAAAPVKSAWKPAPPPQPAPVWGSGINPVLANHSSPPPPPSMNGSAAAQVTPNRQPPVPPVIGVSQQRLSDSALNINAKEFVPGNL